MKNNKISKRKFHNVESFRINQEQKKKIEKICLKKKFSKSDLFRFALQSYLLQNNIL